MTERIAADAATSPSAVFERRFRWPATSTLAFLGVLAVLVAVGVMPRWLTSRATAGLPNDAGVAAAAELVRGGVTFPVDGLRFLSSLYGGVPGGRVGYDMDRRLDEAERLLASAPRRVRSDPRWNVAQGSIDLARHRFRLAARHYQQAIDATGDYPEARLGLGTTLALAARFDRHPLAERRTTLRAIAQFAAVEPNQPFYLEALFDRVVLLDRVGRTEEARRLAGAYLEREPTGVWADAMRNVAQRSGS